MPRMKHYSRYPVEYFDLASVADSHEPVDIEVQTASRANSVRTELYNMRLSLRKAAHSEADFPYHEVRNKFERLRFIIRSRPERQDFVVRVEPIGYTEIFNSVEGEPK